MPVSEARLSSFPLWRSAIERERKAELRDLLPKTSLSPWRIPLFVSLSAASANPEFLLDNLMNRNMLARKRALGRSPVRSMLYEWSRKRRDVTSPEVFSDEEASFMTRFAFRVLVVAMILALLPMVSFAAGESSAGSANTAAAPPAATSPAATTAASPSPATSLPGSDPLLNLLVSK